MDFVAGLSTLTLCLMVLISLMTLWFIGPGYNSHSATHSPTILTSTGIFGTFLGVAIGLFHFDTGDIQASVPSLIDGLKTAFWTSIAGLMGALIVKFRHLTAILKQRKVDEQYSQASITDLANLLGEINESLSNREVNGLRSALEHFQQDQRQVLGEVRDSLGDFQAQMVDANTRALIMAIEGVLNDFNSQINVQYGDNFKELNRAVGQMLQWQENYKKELEELLTTQRSNGDLLDKASNAYKEMVGHSEVFNRVSSSLGQMLEVLQGQADGLDQYLSQLARVANQASEGLPALEQRVQALTTDLASSMTQSQAQVSHLMTQSAEALRQTSETINTQLAQAMTQSQDGLSERIGRMVERTESQVMRLDDAMEDELTKALKTFGYQLTSLSEKFVSDYAPLTDKLRQLIELSENTVVRNELAKTVNEANSSRAQVQQASSQ